LSTETPVAPGSDDRPTTDRMEVWIRSVGTTTLPLLAGFSITAVVVVAGNAAAFLWPGVTVFVLTVAAVTLMIAVQRAYHACMYISEDRSNAASDRVRDLVRHTRRAYRIGLLFFLGGLALAVAPKQVTGAQDFFRLAAVVVSSGACLYEAWWMARDFWMRAGAQSD
jgi:hypothetical protein